MGEIPKCRRESGRRDKSPLKKVTGHVDSMEAIDSGFRDPKTGEPQEYMSIRLSKLVVHDSDIPYDLKTAEINDVRISHSSSGAFAVFENSVAAVFGMQPGEVGCDHIVGKTVTLERDDDHVFRGNKDGGDKITGRVWRVVDSADAGPKLDPYDAVVALLDGKEYGSFVQSAVSDANIRRDPALLNAVMSGDIKQDARITSTFDVDGNGVYHKK